MSSPRIYFPNEGMPGKKIQLSENASRHLLKALRLKTGESLSIFDGKGREWNAVLTSSEKKLAVVEIGPEIARKTESSLLIHLVYGLARFEKTEWVIQKATELGVNKITLLMTQHGEVHLPEKSIINRLERWQSIVISACEQSGRLNLPEIEKPLHFNEWIKHPLEGLKLIFHPDGKATRSDLKVSQKKKVVLMVGPEGGFSEKEVQEAIDQGFEIVSLGERILRTETAAISVIAMAQTLWGDWS